MGWFLLAILVAFGLVVKRWRAFFDAKEESLDVGAATAAFGKYCLMTVPVAVALSAITFISYGQRGVVFDTFRGVRPLPLNEGGSFVIPFIQTVYKMSVQVEKEDVIAMASSKDLQEVHTTVTINYRLVPESCPELFQQVGMSFSDKLIAPAVQEVVKASTAMYKAEELVAQREAVKQKIHDALSKLLAKHGILLTETYITNFKFSDGYTAAIEAKQVADQEAQKAQRVLAQKQFEAQQKIVMAKAEAEGLKAQKEAISPGLLKLREIEMKTKMVEKWNGQMPTVMTGGGGANLFDLTSMMKPVNTNSGAE